MSYQRRQSGLSFSASELKDLGIAWLALGVAFTFFLNPGIASRVATGASGAVAGFVEGLALSMLTVGVGFLLHELAHKVVAVHFGQLAEFRADYGMLFLAIMAGLVGFLFAAPGAVYHRGNVTARENGLIALAGPVTNLALAAVFLGVGFAGGYLGRIGGLGLTINLLLAGFNMIPYGPLDGKKVLSWSTLVYIAVAVPSIGLALFVFVL